MEKIHALGQKYGFRIIEDASHAIGGRYKNNAIGGCQFSDITVFSFHPVKIITTGEGGMCTTNDPELAISLNRFRSHGIVRHPSEMTHISDGPWYYQQVELGYNYRMTDIQAALGLSQIRRIDDFIKSRITISKRYNELLNLDWLELPWQHKDSYSALHLYIIRIKKNNKGITHPQLFEKLRNAGVLVNLHYIPVYRHPYYELKGYDKKDFPNAEAYYSEAISLPIFSSLTDSEQQFVIDIIKKPIGHQNLF
jgi:dTDP-4-amino-4,6-dideoxygalactose transaminase